MTKTTKPKDKTASSGGMPSIIPAFTKLDAQHKFVQRIKKTKLDDGANSSLDKFLVLMSDLCAERQSFTFQDLALLGRYHDIPPLELNELAQKWVEVMVDLRKAHIVNGCYDTPVICLV